MGARLLRARGLRNAVPTLLDLQRRDTSVRFRRNDTVLRIARETRFSDTVMQLMRSDNLQRLADVVGPADGVVVDAGAHSGLFSALVKRSHADARVVAIEANPHLVPIIRQNLAPFDNWDVVPKVLTNKLGQVTFYCNVSATQVSALDRGSAEAFGTEPAEPISVQSTTLDAIAAEFGLDGIDVLKMDVQGGETRAIAGAVRMLPRIRKLIIEVSFLDARPEILLVRLHEEFGDPTVLQLVAGGADLLYTRS